MTRDPPRGRGKILRDHGRRPCPRHRLMARQRLAIRSARASTARHPCGRAGSSALSCGGCLSHRTRTGCRGGARSDFVTALSRPAGAFLHALALLLAAGADVGAFTQTVQLVLPQADWVALLVVFGLTAVVLYIAHMVGVMLREASAARDSAGNRRRLGRGLTAFVCTLVWLGVGVLAFWVRYTVPLPVAPQVGGCGVIGSGSTGGCSPSGAGHGHALQAAAIFLGLYLATGIVAAVGAYVTHNPYRGGYVTAIRAYRRASERVSASIHQVGLALAAHQRQQAEIEAAKEIIAQAKDQNNAFTDQLKQEALIEIASLLKDPAVTDAFFT